MPTIVEKVQSYFYEDESFSTLFENFSIKHAQEINLHSDEMRLKYTDIYNEFQTLFENTIGDFITKEGSTLDEFYSLVKDAYEEDEDSEVAVFAQILMATTDFDVFMQLMRDAAKELPEEKQYKMSEEELVARGILPPPGEAKSAKGEGDEERNELGRDVVDEEEGSGKKEEKEEGSGKK